MTAYEKGKQIKILGGTHKNKTVWLNTAKPERTDKRVYVVVEDDKGTRATWTSPRFISHEEIAGPPKSYAHAILKDQPKTELMWKNLIHSLAKCDLDAEASNEFVEFFKSSLTEAVKQQASLGSLYKKVDFKKDELAEDMML
jgi:hypothetical protein